MSDINNQEASAVITDLPNDPAMRDKLKAGIEEMVGSMIRAEGEKTLQKEIGTALALELGMKSSKIHRLARNKLKGDVAKRAEALAVEEQECEILFGTTSI